LSLTVNKDQAQSVDIISIDLTSHTGEVIDLIYVFSKLEIVEEIDNFVTIGSISLIDTIGLKEHTPLIGGEKINIQFRTNKSFEIYDKDFIIVKLGPENNIDPNKTEKVLTLFFASELLLENAKRQYSIGFKNKKVSNILQAVFTDLLKGKEIEIENTLNNINFIIPYWNPFKAIKYLMEKAVSNTNDSGYLFFENKNKFVFKSISSLFKEKPEVNRKIKLNKITKNDELSVNSAKSNYKFLRSVDIIKDITEGVLGNSVYTFDYANKSFMKKTLDYKKYLDNTYTLGSNSLYPKDYDFKDANVDVFNNHNEKIDDKYSFPNEINEQAKNQVRNKNRYRSLNNLPFLFKKNGDSNLTIGMVLEVEFLSVQDGKKFEDRLNGNYLISKCRHIITKKGYQQNLVLTTDAYQQDDKNITYKIGGKVNK